MASLTPSARRARGPLRRHRGRGLLFEVERFPQPGGKIKPTRWCRPPAAAPPMRRSRWRGSAATARFAGPIGDPTEMPRRPRARRACARRRRLSRLRARRRRLDPVSGIFIDAGGERMIATRRGSKLEARGRAIRPHGGRVDVVMADNRFPDFVQPICEAARARGIPVVVDGDWPTTRRTIRCSPSPPTSIFSAEALRASTGMRISQRPCAWRHSRSTPSSRSPTVPPMCCGCEGAVRTAAGFRGRRPSTRSAPATPSTAPSRWRWPKAATSRRRCASAAAAAALKCTRFGGISGHPDPGRGGRFPGQQQPYGLASRIVLPSVSAKAYRALKE